MSIVQTAKPSDPLAGLRIDRNRARPRSSGWFGKFLLLCFLAAIGWGGYWAWQKYGDELTRPEVKVASVEVRAAGAADSILSAQGYLKSEKQAAIGAKVPGRVLKIFVREGQSVDASEVIAELEHADMDQTLEAMKASYEATGSSLEAMSVALTKAKAELSEVESNANQDERDYKRAERLFQSRQLSTAEYEQSESKFKASRSRRESMKAAVALSEARLRESEAMRRESQARFHEAEQQRQNLFVRAPFKGVVISKEAEEGESIMPGGMGAASGRGSVVTLADLLHLEVETDVKEDYVSRVRKDQRVSVSVDAVPNRQFSGKVRTIIPMGDRSKGTVKIKVQLDDAEVRTVNNTKTEEFTLFPEMAATVHFLGEAKAEQKKVMEAKVFVPAESVEKNGETSFVWTVVDEKVKKVVVETGDLQGGRMQIKKGLKGGERVVLNPAADLKEDTRVKITQ